MIGKTMEHAVSLLWLFIVFLVFALLFVLSFGKINLDWFEPDDY